MQVIQAWYLKVIAGKQDLLPLGSVGHMAAAVLRMMAAAAVGHTAVTHHRYGTHATRTLPRHLEIITLSYSILK